MKPQIAATILSCILCSCNALDKTNPAAESGATPVAFGAQIKPIFERRCVRCHNSKTPNAGLDLQDRQSVFDSLHPGSREHFLVPREPRKSLIYKAVTQPSTHPNMMPGDGWGLNAEQEQHLYQWIKEGAFWPHGFRGSLRAKKLRVDFDEYL
jgi:hypothetical protein